MSFPFLLPVSQEPLSQLPKVAPVHSLEAPTKFKPSTVRGGLRPPISLPLLLPLPSPAGESSLLSGTHGRLDQPDNVPFSSQPWERGQRDVGRRDGRGLP